MLKRIVLRIFLGAGLFLMCVPTAQALLRKDMSYIRGMVVAYDPRTRLLVVNGDKGEGEVTLDIAGAQVTAPTTAGEEVVVIYKMDNHRASVVKTPFRK